LRAGAWRLLRDLLSLARHRTSKEKPNARPRHFHRHMARGKVTRRPRFARERSWCRVEERFYVSQLPGGIRYTAGVAEECGFSPAESLIREADVLPCDGPS